MSLDFFKAQDEAKTKSKLLLAAFFSITVIVSMSLGLIFFFFFGYENHIDIVFFRQFLNNPSTTLNIALCVFLVITIQSFYMSREITAQGIDSFLRSIHCTKLPFQSDDFYIKRYRNVVQEMAIAAGLPIPALYTMDAVQSINAFAAGFSHDQAAIVITKGALQKLTRPELQGVVAHEFSHILNSDMKTNMLMISILHGYTSISSIGRKLMRGRGFFFGIVIFVCGSFGILVSKILSAMFTRQREWLADASAVQFTRNPSGLAGALGKIDLDYHGSLVTCPKSDAISHMFFADGVTNYFSQLLASHPAIENRIRALGVASYRSPKQKKQVPLDSVEEVARSVVTDNRAYVISLAEADKIAQSSKTSPIATTIPTASSVGTISPESIERATSILQKLPQYLKDACENPSKSLVIVFAILVHCGSNDPKKAISFLRQSRWYAQALVDYLQEEVLWRLSPLGILECQVLMQLACATQRDAGEVAPKKFLLQIISLINSDNKVSLTELCMLMLAASEILDPSSMQQIGASNRVSAKADLLKLHG